MANSLYADGRNGFARGDIKWRVGGDTIRCFLLEDTYTPDLTGHSNLSNIGVGLRIGNSGGTALADAPALTLSDPVAGVCDAADVTFTAVPNSHTAGYIVIFKDTGDESTSTLIAVIDAGVGLPITTNGGDIIIRWDNGVNRIFKL